MYLIFVVFLHVFSKSKKNQRKGNNFFPMTANSKLDCTFKSPIRSSIYISLGQLRSDELSDIFKQRVMINYWAQVDSGTKDVLLDTLSLGQYLKALLLLLLLTSWAPPISLFNGKVHCLLLLPGCLFTKSCFHFTRDAPQLLSCWG